MYLFAKSTDSVELFPSNEPGHFFINLPQSLHHKRFVSCALIQCCIPQIKTSVKELLIYISCVTESVVSDRQVSIIYRKVMESDNMCLFDQQDISYVPLKNIDTNVIEVQFLNGSDMSEVEFYHGVTYCTFHFVESRTEVF